MNSEKMNEQKSRSKIFETILSSPGMTEKCKITLMVSRQNIILIGRLLEAGFSQEKNQFDEEIMAALPKESLEELKLIHEEVLKKGELTEFYEKLKLL